MQDNTVQNYTPSELSDRYSIELGEAQRLITSFGADRTELDRLLGARGRIHEEIETRLAA
ncbi:hypothetical protein GAO09_12140 [Rhizobiales bacterium RZME27]|jgi:hypothetical protein|uniref:DUF3606 domain-containing protein n=1 Tax=Endobacterium cereale TaxID=2663029 RepID=A0A6A8AAW1_9HYPH|nr:hypothetical protein [Endobacterium cereale]MEB2847883.1 hypothetical protein [Endobacterium cereale]MQY46780.1 hypothetical protein [Endobacterium cereale]